MNPSNSFLYFSSALIAIVGATLYHFALKKLPEGMNPIFNITVVYFGATVISLILLPFFGGMTTVKEGITHLNWVQLALIFGVFMIEIGFLLMYRNGWTISAGNIVTGVAINIALIALGMLFFAEKLSVLNIAGAILATLGVALLSL